MGLADYELKRAYQRLLQEPNRGRADMQFLSVGQTGTSFSKGGGFVLSLTRRTLLLIAGLVLAVGATSLDAVNRCQFCATWRGPGWWVIPRIDTCCSSGNAGEDGTCGSLGYDNYNFWGEGRSDCWLVKPDGENGQTNCEFNDDGNCTIATAPEPDSGLGLFLIAFNGQPRMNEPGAGVLFDLHGTGTVLRTSWPGGGVSGWLTLDRNGNGVVDGGGEMFWATRRPSTGSQRDRRQMVLADYDANGDGVLDAADPVWRQLRIWIDSNHDGVSDRSELIAPERARIRSISTNAGGGLGVEQRGKPSPSRGVVTMSDGRVLQTYSVSLATRVLAGTQSVWRSSTCGVAHE
jgi:hypothetical protein